MSSTAPVVGIIMGWPLFGAQAPLLIFAAVMAALIVYKHRTNIARLRAGTENRFEKKKPPATSSSAAPPEGAS